MFRSVRWRLTGWYIVILTATLLLFSMVTYLAVRTMLLDNFDDVLLHQAQLITQTIDVANAGPVLRGSVLLDIQRDSEHFTRLYRADGVLLFEDNATAEGAPVLTTDVREALRGRSTFTEVSVREGPMRIATFPINHNGRLTGALQVGVSLEDIERTMRKLRRVLLLLTPTVMLLASGGGWFLANRLLTPIDRITRMAQRISAKNLSGRINLRGPDDEVKRLAQTFDAMLARLEAAFVRQREFTADASHELRTPLTAIIGQIDVALGRPREAESYRQVLVAMREQAQRLARLAADLLFLARADTQPAVVAAEPLDLGILVPAVVAQVEPLAAARDQTIALVPVLSLPIRGNEDHLIRLLLNLFDNAIRYTPPGGKISVTGAQEGAKITIRVSDSGPGIAPEHLPRLFDRFYRVDRGRNRLQGDSGLGLAIAQSIAQQHGGRIKVESAIGRGSTFSVILPAIGSAETITLRQVAVGANGLR